jgi:Mg2+-importing ATPase
MSSTEQGLSGVEAARRLAAYGPNEPAPVRRFSAVVQLFHLFANPLVVILLVASAIAGSLGQQVDALIIVTMVVLGVSINFWQSYRSQHAAERLRSSVIPTATVLRDGVWLETAVRRPPSPGWCPDTARARRMGAPRGPFGRRSLPCQPAYAGHERPLIRVGCALKKCLPNG